MIVAIPEKRDPVWKISSEKVPHLTLCYLGDQVGDDAVIRITEYLAHVVKTSMRPFGLGVKRRGALGENQADVLFFKESHADELRDIRSYLLANGDIYNAYHSTDQYEKWLPHLTLGYPETPAHPEAEDSFGIDWVYFDRIALWTGDYEGAEFHLDDPVDDILKHFGVKGMHWGVRKGDDPGVQKLVAPSLQIDPTLARSTQVAGAKIASLMGQRYGFQISEIRSIPHDHPEHDLGLMGYVVNTPGRAGNVVYANSADIRKPLKDAEKMGWFGKDCGTPEAFFTHESAHAIFHAEQKTTTGFFGGQKIVGGNIKARDKALEAAAEEAVRNGIPHHLFSSKVSGYAHADGSRQEVEAEMFAQYHWNPNPPSFIKVWGETLHKELGLDPTPFREVGR